jgi:RNA recognition motif. (a.k.a. RRM, RBD, or RNP domain)
LPQKRFAAAVKNDSFSHIEFGDTVYGPLRNSYVLAKDDSDAIRKALDTDILSLRKIIAILGAQGGTCSRMPLGNIPFLKRLEIAPFEVLSDAAATGELVKICGSRRKFLSVVLYLDKHHVGFLRRVLDFTVDLLGACVDIGFGLKPTIATLKGAYQRVFRNSRDLLLENEPSVERLAETFLDSQLFSEHLKNPDSDSDSLVMNSFVEQLSKKAFKSDEQSRVAVKKDAKKITDLKRKIRNTIVVWNLPRNITRAELNEFFDYSGLEEINFPHNNYSAGFAFLKMSNSESCDRLLASDNLKFQERILFFTRQKISEALRLKLLGERVLETTKVSCIFKLPPSVQIEIKEILKEKPGCNIGYVQQKIGRDKLNPQMFGFRNLVKALQSVDGVRIERIQRNPTVAPYYQAFLDIS